MFGNFTLIKDRAKEICWKEGATGNVMDLGHRIKAGTPEENAAHFIETVWNFYHRVSGGVTRGGTERVYDETRGCILVKPIALTLPPYVNDDPSSPAGNRAEVLSVDAVPPNFHGTTNVPMFANVKASK